MSIVEKKIVEKVKTLGNLDDSIVVLKGIPVSVVDTSFVEQSVESLVNNKLKYFMGLVSSGRKFITYEEFLALNSFILDQYEKVYVLVNNIYINQFPLDISVSDETRRGLLAHFMESENDYDDTPIGNIDEIIDLYDGVREYNGYLIGAYCEDKIPNDNKIRNVNLFDYISSFEFDTVDSPDDNSLVMDFLDEGDYIDFVKQLFSEPDDLYVNFLNYSGDKESLSDHLAILASNWADYTDIHIIRPKEVEDSFEHREEYTDILKKYWGYPSFQSIPMYNMKKLDEGKKEVKDISQEQIISDLVRQAENCENAGESRDVFVTAPTGAGKSVMFQVPAIYLAEKYNLLTIVISPLIGLMNDQVVNLERRGYKGAKTINSDISPIVKEEILDNVANGTYHILYLSPETLLARSTVEQLIGDRTIGMIIIDEAHIVTTWGKQFRPDYWYLGEHIRKLRANQIKNKGRSFVVGTFTATAIYHGVEDMYEETKNSLFMFEPITYLGYVKRSDIEIKIDAKKKNKSKRSEYRTDKYNEIIDIIKRAKLTNKKTLVYFPTVRLIEDCYDYVHSMKMAGCVTKYYGPLDKDKKSENYQAFLAGEKLVMFATKAFGMGIDIDNIELVGHYAPTGNVCDYVQEIGRAARRRGLNGEAFYYYHSEDFQFINRMHGLSTIKKYHLIEVIKKIDELYQMKVSSNPAGMVTKKRNAMLIDAENFTYIFDNPMAEGDENINKVKTALLIIQKDFENKIGFSPINVRPIPLFSLGFFAIDLNTQANLKKAFGDCVEEINSKKHICRVNLERIWDKGYKNKSFPQFKYLVYSGDREKEIDFCPKYPINPALCVSVEFCEDYLSKFRSVWGIFKNIVREGTITQGYIYNSTFVEALCNNGVDNKYKATTICEVVFAAMDIYRRKFSRTTNSIFSKKELNSGKIEFQFSPAASTFFKWVENEFERIQNELEDGSLYIVDTTGTTAKEVSTVLGILEALDVLKFEMTGGAGSQLYIYINQVRNLKTILKNPGGYNNHLLEIVNDRHIISVKLLTYLYESGFNSDQIWEIIEDYFLGTIPERVKIECRKENPNIRL